MSTQSSSETSSSESASQQTTLEAPSNVHFKHNDVNIAFNNVVALKEGKGEERLSVIMEYLLGKDYLNENLKPIKSFQITDATFKDSKVSEVPLTSYMRRVSKLPEKPLNLPSEDANIEATGDKSLSRTSVHPVSTPKAKIEKKRMKKKNPSSSELNISTDVAQTLTPQASESQASKAPEGEVNPTHAYYNASKTSKDNEDPSWSTRNIHSNDGFANSGLQSLGDIPLESLHKDINENLYDTESKIKIVKRFNPTSNDEESLFTSVTKEFSVIGEASDLESMPGDKIGSVSASETIGSLEDDIHSPQIKLSKSEERDVDEILAELADLNASADKPSLSDHLGNLCKEVSHLTTNVQNLESSLLQQMTAKLEEIVPSLVAKTLKENMPDIISESLKSVIPQITAESVKEIIKPINKQFNAFNKLEAARFVKLYTGLRRDLKKKVGISVRKKVHKGIEIVKGKVDNYTTRVDQNTQNVHEMTTLMRDMVHLLTSASVFAKANAEGEKWEQANPDPLKAEQKPPINEQVFKSSTDLVIYSSKIKTTDETSTEDEPPSKKTKFKIPREILSPTPLNSIRPQLTTPIVINMPQNQDSSSPSKPADKGKAIATEEDSTKALIPLLEESGSSLKIFNLNLFSSDGGQMTIEKSRAQMEGLRRIELLKSEKELLKMLNPATIKAQTHKLAEYKAKRSKMIRGYNDCITKRLDPLLITKISYTTSKSTKEATIRITRNNDPATLTVYDNFVLKMLGLTKWIKVHNLASKGLPPPTKLSAYRLNLAERKGKRDSDMIEEMFVKQDIRIPGMKRNLTLPPGIIAVKGKVIIEPEAGIFFYNENFDYVFQRENEFHLATTAQLIR
ncbi:hypothetical protein Tco_0261653 [Tanacetum coccineum]